MTDIDDAMEETREKAKSKFGVGSDADGASDDETATTSEASGESGTSATEEAPESPETTGLSETSETQATSEISEAPETSETSETTGSAGATGTRESSEPESEAERGRLVDEYENVNIYIPGELKEELNFLFKQMDLEHSRATGDGLEKHWDFYPAVVRTVLRNEDDLRDELGIE